MKRSNLATTVHHECATSRRDFLTRAGAGFGSVALAALAAQQARASHSHNDDEEDEESPLGPKDPHFKPRATNVIWLFVDGGPSAIDLLDPKPELQKLAGKPLPPSFKRPVTAMGATANTPLLGTQRTFRQYGESGLWLSDWLPHLSKVADDLCVVRSCTADAQTHVGAVTQMNTGTMLAGFPSWGAWCLYGLGVDSDELPGYVVMTDNSADPPGGSRAWGTGFMPAVFQGTRLGEGKDPILYLSPAQSISADQQRRKLDFLQQLNKRYAEKRDDDDRLEARVEAYELAFKMQSSAPIAVNIADETEETRKLYGLDNEATASNGRNCLLARRMVERGVRCVQVYLGCGSLWDAHSDLEGNHSKLCRESDQPVAALLQDLKRRGLLDTTLVVWAGEFGRTPMSESGNGRDHNPFGFSLWMAGGGVKPGLTFGATDEIGLYAIENKVHVHDIHATILHLMGLDHEQLTYPHNGRDERLTIVEGAVMHSILA